MPRLRDRAVVLIPQRTADPNTNASRIDWSLPPEEIPTPFEAQAQRAGGGDLDEGTVPAAWSAWLPVATRVPGDAPEDPPVVVDLDARFHAGCRIRWHDRVYKVDGPVRRPRRGGRVQFLAVTLRVVDRAAAVVAP